MTATTKIKIESGHQLIPIPDNFKIEGEEVYIKKVGNILYIVPVNKPWQSLFESLSQFTPDFMINREELTVQPRESFD